MKLHIISDLHIDINSKIPFSIKDKETFTIICGDISGSIKKTCNWLDANIHNGLFVAGNHMFYDEPKLTVDDIVSTYKKIYPITKKVSFLNNNTKIINDIVFVGCTLWTDYKLLGEGSADLYKYYATHGMNDFKYGHIKQNGNIRPLNPEYCEKEFKKSVKYIQKVAEQYPDKTVVVITHHAPSMQSIEKNYRNSELVASFASNLENFILDHPNIKLWCHGHIHSCCDYMIGGCRIVCNPRGYEQYQEYTDFNKNLILDI